LGQNLIDDSGYEPENENNLI